MVLGIRRRAVTAQLARGCLSGSSLRRHSHLMACGRPPRGYIPEPSCLVSPAGAWRKKGEVDCIPEQFNDSVAVSLWERIRHLAMLGDRGEGKWEIDEEKETGQGKSPRGDSVTGSFSTYQRRKVSMRKGNKWPPAPLRYSTKPFQPLSESINTYSTRTAQCRKTAQCRYRAREFRATAYTHRPQRPTEITSQA